MFLTPVDTFKTTLQVQGNAALELLKQKVSKGGVGVLYNGAAANFAANWVGNYPWQGLADGAHPVIHSVWFGIELKLFDQSEQSDPNQNRVHFGSSHPVEQSQHSI